MFDNVLISVVMTLASAIVSAKSIDDADARRDAVVADGGYWIDNDATMVDDNQRQLRRQHWK